MRCPVCQSSESKVVDSRTTGDAIRRRRECLDCSARFTTHERVEQRVVWVVKKDGRKEPFSREKVLHGISLACRKRPLDAQAMDGVVARVEAVLESGRGAEVTSADVGEAVMRVLREVDEIAYLRFCSVYQEFESLQQFLDTIRPLTEPT